MPRYATVKQYRRAAADELAALTCIVLSGVGTSRSWPVVNIDQTLRTHLETLLMLTNRRNRDGRPGRSDQAVAYEVNTYGDQRRVVATQ